MRWHAACNRNNATRVANGGGALASPQLKRVNCGPDPRVKPTFDIHMRGKQKRIFLKQRRTTKREVISRYRMPIGSTMPAGAVLADRALHAHIHSYRVVEYYVDQPFTCRDCGLTEVWKAEDRKRYVEFYKGHTSARAIRCRNCRNQERARVAEVRERSLMGLLAKQQRPKRAQQGTSINKLNT